MEKKAENEKKERKGSKEKKGKKESKDTSPRFRGEWLQPAPPGGHLPMTTLPQVKIGTSPRWGRSDFPRVGMHFRSFFDDFPDL